MLMGANGANGRVASATFTAQWRDERVRRELVALDLSWGRLARRDYAGALQVLEGSMSAAGGKVSVGRLSLLMYRLRRLVREEVRRSLTYCQPARGRASVPSAGAD